MPAKLLQIVNQLRKWDPLRRLRYRLEYGMLLCVAVCLPRLPRRCVLALGNGIGWLGFHLDRRGRRLGSDNLQLAIRHGGLDLHGKSIDDTLRQCYQNFARGFVDLFWFAGLKPSDMERWVQLEASDELNQWLSTGQGGIFLTPHYGIFEWASLAVGWCGVQLDVVAQDFRNEALTDIFSTARQHSGHRIVSRQGAMLKLVRSVKQGGNIALLPDLNIPPQGAAVPINVFGISAWMTAVHAEISLRFDVPMLIAVCEPHPDGRVTLKIIDLVKASHQSPPLTRDELSQRVWDCFEAAIRHRPELWLWMYRHWRYRSDSQLPLGDESSVSQPPADSPPATSPLMCSRPAA